MTRKYAALLIPGLSSRELAPFRLESVVGASDLPFYASWNDPASQQRRRRSIGTTSLTAAIAEVKRWIEDGIADPRFSTRKKPIEFVHELIERHRDAIDDLASREAGHIQANRIARLLGDKRVAMLTREDFVEFKNICVKEGCSLPYVDRTLSTLVAACRDAVADHVLKDKPYIPKFANKNVLRSRPLKGRVLEIEEIASLFDAIEDLHVLVFMVLLVNTASRPGALLEVTTAQIDPRNRLLHLNAEGRVQTSKWRPTLPIPSTLDGWLAGLPAAGPLVRWRGAQVAEIDTAFRQLCSSAKIADGATPYSLRHTIGRHLRKQRVDTEEISIWLGHIQPPQNEESTLLYSPYEPDYLSQAQAATEEFVRRLNTMTRHDLLKAPWS